MKVPRLRIAPDVRPHHGATFAEEWIDRSFDTGSINEAFEATHLVEFPVSTARREIPAQERYGTIEEEILERTLAIVSAQIAEAFVKIATEVLDRERRRQHGRETKTAR